MATKNFTTSTQATVEAYRPARTVFSPGNFIHGPWPGYHPQTWPVLKRPPNPWSTFWPW